MAKRAPKRRPPKVPSLTVAVIEVIPKDKKKRVKKGDKP